MFVALLGIYVVYYRSAEAILPALCVDAFFGSEYFIPFYTLITTVALAGTLWIAPFLVMYNERV